MYAEQIGRAQHYRFTNQETFSGNLQSVCGFVEYNYCMGMHVQEFFEINVIVRGSGMHYIENRRIPAKRGDVFIIPPDTAHGYEGGQGFDVYHLTISQGFMQKYTTDLQKLPSFFILFKAEPLMRTGNSLPFHLTLTDAQLNETEQLLREIKAHSGRCTASSAVISNSLVMILITIFCEIYTENSAGVDCTGPRHDEAFAEALALIYQRYNEKWSIASLAKVAQLSRSSFIRKFQQVCKMPPAKFITLQRIEAAKSLLVNTGLSVSEIAGKTGFYDTSHFIKIFTSETGTSPNAYRREHTGSAN